MLTFHLSTTFLPWHYSKFGLAILSNSSVHLLCTAIFPALLLSIYSQFIIHPYSQIFEFFYQLQISIQISKVFLLFWIVLPISEVHQSRLWPLLTFFLSILLPLPLQPALALLLILIPNTSSTSWYSAKFFLPSTLHLYRTCLTSLCIYLINTSPNRIMVWLVSIYLSSPHSKAFRKQTGKTDLCIFVSYVHLFLHCRSLDLSLPNSIISHFYLH